MPCCLGTRFSAYGIGAQTRLLFEKVLGARSSEDAQLGPLFAGFLKILPVFLLVLPGVIAYVLFPTSLGAQ